MSGAQIHYEVFSKRTPGGGWVLDMATEDRAGALGAANEMMKGGKVAAVRVTKESLDPDTREFQSIGILSLGNSEAPKKSVVREDNEPLCLAPQDLYTLHARERIGRLLEGFLERKGATPFELLHRADLVEELEASGTDLQHAIQKLAIPEAQARGLTVHDLIRTLQSLVERAIERLLKDARKGEMPNLDKEGFARAAERVAQHPERAYLLGAGVAVSIAPARSWTEKITRLLDLADAAPLAGPPRALALAVIEQPLAEILGSKSGLDDILGKELDLGARLASMIRLAACEPVEALMGVEASVARMMPPLSAPAQRLARWLATEDFGTVRLAIAKRVVRDLTGPRRLRPGDTEGEIAVMRALAMALTCAAGTMLTLDDVQEAFTTRSRMLVTGDFVETYLGTNRTSRQEVEALMWLVENVIGAANKRQAGRYLSANVSAMRFEKEFRLGPDSPGVKLEVLAKLQKQAARSGLTAEDYGPIQGKIGEVGGLVEADSKVVAIVAKSAQGPVHRLMVLLRMATGDTAPTGPTADRARVEALKLVRRDDTRAELARAPERMGQVRELLQAMTAAA